MINLLKGTTQNFGSLKTLNLLDVENVLGVEIRSQMSESNT